jgi:hypothetical protein
VLIIRDQQLKALNAARLEDFKQRIVQYLGSAHAARIHETGAAPTREFVEQAFRKSQDFQIFVESDVARFIEVSFLRGLDFEKTEAMSWSAPLLADHALDGNDKMSRIWAWVESEEELD